MSNTPSRFRRKARTTPVTLAVDPDDAPVIADAQANVDQAKAVLEQLGPKGTAAEKREAQRRLDDAEAEQAQVLAEHPTVTLTLQAVAKATREALIADHPATAEEQAAYDKADKPDGAPASMQFSPDGYYPALLAASCIKVEWSDDPDATTTGLTEDDARDLWETASEGDCMVIQAATQMLVIASSRVETLGKG